MEPYIISGLFTIAGAIVGGFIGYFSAKRMSAITTKCQAGIKLRAAFSFEMAQMRLFASGKTIAHPRDPQLKGGDYIHFLLNIALRKHAKAIEVFSPYVPDKHKKAYYEAWEKYYDSGFHNYYMGDKPYELFFERIHAVLQFTEI
ncbi:MAG: hypothetical protein QME90_04550 [Thermodesulfobacteriota bacterium]|nr:hypothetical protein [Thermodesulfobacteriota bacterium]